MKKLALALLCLVSVAFFASCDHDVENPEPVISVLTTAGYLADSTVIEADTDYPFGFVVSANPETLKDIVRVELFVNDMSVDTVENIDAQTYTYESIFRYDTRQIIDEVEIRIQATDADNKTQTAKLHFWVNQEEYLVEKNIAWVRRGADVQSAEEMATYGLEWKGSYKEVFATIEPMEGYTLYLTDDAEFASIETAVQKANFVAALMETSKPIEKYRNITTNNSADYNDLLVVIGEDGVTNLVNFKHASIETGSFGTQITITGSVK